MKLFNYQQKIYNIIKDQKSVALFMEPGTGKTIISQYVFDNNKSKKLLIICLASKVKEWDDDCNLFYKDKYSRCMLNKGTNINKKLIKENYDIFIISFQSALLISKELLNIVNNEFMIIIDESQVIKNHKSKISKLCHKLGEKTEYKMILTGTPHNKGYIDYFSQLKFLGVFNKYIDFQDNFCIMKQVRYGPTISFKEIAGYRNTSLLDNIIGNNAIFFKRDRNIDEIPTEKYIDFDRNKEYPDLIKKRVYKDIAAVNGGVLRMRARQFCGGAINGYKIDTDKLAWVRDFIENNCTQIVIFYNFNEECSLLKEIVIQLNRPLAIYNGTEKNISEFENKEDCILLVNYQSGGTGINWLKKANIAIFWAPPESYMIFEQSRKRIDRIGQTKKPMFYYLRTKNTVEELIYKSLEKREDYTDAKFKQYLERINNENI